MTTRIDIINRALIRIGQNPVQAETSPGADAYVMVYEDAIGALVSCYPWSFQTKLGQLGQLAAPPPSLYNLAYRLPSDLLGTPRAVYNIQPVQGQTLPPSLPVTAFDIMGDKLFTNASPIYIRYTFSLLPTRWPGYFREMAILALAAEFALSIREDAALRASMRREVYGDPREQLEGGLIAAAKSIDASSQASRGLKVSNPLTAGRISSIGIN